MKKSDLKLEPKAEFDLRMLYAPENKFFKTESEQIKSMEERLEFLSILQGRSKMSGLFRLSDEFMQDFIERND